MIQNVFVLQKRRKRANSKSQIRQWKQTKYFTREKKKSGHKTSIWIGVGALERLENERQKNKTQAQKSSEESFAMNWNSKITSVTYGKRLNAKKCWANVSKIHFIIVLVLFMFLFFFSSNKSLCDRKIYNNFAFFLLIAMLLKRISKLFSYYTP